MTDSVENPGSHIQTDGGGVVGRDASAGRDFVGRDQNIGMSGEEVSRLVETVLKNIQPEYIRPQQLDEALTQFRQYHETLSEWKELHNFLDNTLQFYDQFWDLARAANRKNLLLADLQNRWLRISLELDGMLKWAATIQYIGRPYNETGDGRLDGEKWAIDLEIARRDIANHLAQAQKLIDSSSASLFNRLAGQNPLDEQWARQLAEYASRYRSLILFYMHQANANLLNTATKLTDLSQRVLRR